MQAQQCLIICGESFKRGAPTTIIEMTKPHMDDYTKHHPIYISIFIPIWDLHPNNVNFKIFNHGKKSHMIIFVYLKSQISDRLRNHKLMIHKVDLIAIYM